MSDFFFVNYFEYVGVGLIFGRDELVDYVGCDIQFLSFEYQRGDCEVCGEVM